MAISCRRVVRVVPALLLCLLCLPAAEARAQKLSVQGDRFAIDGTPKFLTFMSFFGAMGAPNIDVDLHVVRRLGFDGIRIWPNLDTGPQLMNGDGTLRPNELAQLRFILDQARREHLVVDVTFTYEHVAGLDAAHDRAGIVAATEALRPYENLIFDIQNERNVQDRRRMSAADVARILAGIKSVDPGRIVTASNSPVDSPEFAAEFTAALGLDVTAYHEPRVSNWYELATMQSVVRAMKSNGRPAYLQESMPTRDALYYYPSHDRADYFVQAIANAKLAGAAAWCFHTDAGTDFRDGPAFLEDRLRQDQEPEWVFVNSLSARVALRTSNALHYVTAEGGGGGAVTATRMIAGPWETFRVVVPAGGPMISGDRIALATADDAHYLQAAGGGGASLGAHGAAVGPWETFIIEKLDGGVIRTGDAVTLRAADAPWYVVAEGGGGGTVNVNRPSSGLWQTFTILFSR